jgi:uncharacterized protein (DUF1810 family)
MTIADDQGADGHNLARFINAQEPVIDDVRTELAAGAKTTHWMWFVFPQIAGLGLSTMSQHYAIAGLAEARAYLAHPVLGPRLRDCTALAMSSSRTALEIFGPVDAQKFFSCLTLFACTANDPIFRRALAQFFSGRHDQGTMTILQTV